jgi:hypothetical protein
MRYGVREQSLALQIWKTKGPAGVIPRMLRVAYICLLDAE